MSALKKAEAALQTERDGLAEREARLSELRETVKTLSQSRATSLLAADYGDESARAFVAKADAELAKLKGELADGEVIMAGRRTRVASAEAKVRQERQRDSEARAQATEREIDKARADIEAALGPLVEAHGRHVNGLLKLEGLWREAGIHGKPTDAERYLAGLLVRSGALDSRILSYPRELLIRSDEERQARTQAEIAALDNRLRDVAAASA